MSANDPVSEFLAREQSALAELGEDFVVAPADTPVAAQQTENTGQNGFFNVDDLTNGTSGHDNAGLMAANNAQFFEDETQGVGRNRASPTLSNSRSQSTQPEEEPEKIKKWREHQKELVEKKDKEEAKKKEELRQQAKKEMEQIQAQRNAQLEQRKKQNRERQAVLNAAAKSADEKDLGTAMWERVARMVEGGSVGGGAGIVSGKSTKPVGQSSALGKDTTRMKQLILLYARGEQGEKSPSPEVP